MSRADKVNRLTLGGALTALAISILWGGNVVGIKVGLETFPPFWSAFWRMLTGITMVGLWGWSQGLRLVPLKGERRWLAALGLLFTVQISAMNHGVNFTSPAYAVVLLNSHPIFANLLGHYFVPEDRLSWARVVGLVLAFGGVCAVFLGTPDESLGTRPILGNLIVTCSGFLLGARTVYTQRLVQTIDPVRPILWMMVCSLPAFLIGALLFEEPLIQPVGARAIGAILYQGVVVAGLCFIVWTTLLKTISPGLLSMFAFSTPIFGVVLSAWIYDESITPRLLFGVIAVTVGIVVATQNWQTKPRTISLDIDGGPAV
jgi:drug/metabolite transporter (DMT)-like permease